MRAQHPKVRAESEPDRSARNAKLVAVRDSRLASLVAVRDSRLGSLVAVRDSRLAALVAVRDSRLASKTRMRIKPCQIEKKARRLAPFAERQRRRAIAALLSELIVGFNK